MTVCLYNKGTLPRGPRGRKRATVLGKGIVEEGVLLHWERQYHTLFLHFALVHGEEGMTSGLFFLSLNILSVFLKGHSFRAACRHDK